MAIRDNSGTDQIRVSGIDDVDYNGQATSYYDLAAGWNNVEVELARSTSDGANDAHVKLWIDETLKETKTGWDLWTRTRPTQFKIGAPTIGPGDISSDCDYAVDEIDCRDESVMIGAYSPSAPTGDTVILDAVMSASYDESAALTVTSIGAPTDHLVAPWASESGGGDGTPGTEWNLKEGAANCDDPTGGDTTVWLRGGLYPPTFSHTIDCRNATVKEGTDDTHRIIFRNYPGEVPILQRNLRLMDAGVTKDWITLRGIQWQTDQHLWVSNTGSDGLQFIDCHFEAAGGSPGSFYGLRLSGGSKIEFTRCSAGTWPQGDMITFDNMDDIVFSQCDFSQSRAEHSIISVQNSTDWVFYQCIFRNPWDRISTTPHTTGSSGDRGLIDQCLYFDADHDPEDPDEGLDSPGAGHPLRMGHARMIVRDCMFIANNIGFDSYSGHGQAALGWLQYDNIDTDLGEAMVYNNVFYKNRSSAIGFSSDGRAGDVDDSHHFNNILYDNGVHGATTSDAINFREISQRQSSVDVKKVTWSYNIIKSVTWPNPIYLNAHGGYLTLAQAEALSNPLVDNPKFANNLDSAPVFADADYWEDFDNNTQTGEEANGDPIYGDTTALSQASVDLFRTAYALQAGSPGLQAGRPHGKVTAAVTSTSIDVEDHMAYAFFANDQSVNHPADIIRIKGPSTDETVTVESITDHNTIVVSSSITVAVDDEIFLVRGSDVLNPSMGLIS
jgi:hypothetical protein